MDKYAQACQAAARHILYGSPPFCPAILAWQLARHAAQHKTSKSRAFMVLLANGLNG
jgi:hypothetical protein